MTDQEKQAQHEKLVADYDIEVPEATANVSSSPETPHEEAKSDRPRDPATGQFVKPAPASPHSKYLTTQAQALGMTAEEIAEYSSDDLRAHITATRIEKAGIHRQPEAPPSTPTPSVQTAEPEDDLGEVEDFDPRLVKILKAVVGRVASLESLKPLIEQSHGFAQSELRRRGETMAQALDREFTKVNMPELFGTGPMKDLDPKSLTVKRRNMLVEEAAKDAPGGIPTKESFYTAMKTLFGRESHVDETEPQPKPKAKANGEAPRISPEQWEQATVAKPTQRQGAPEPNGIAKAKKTYIQQYNQLTGGGDALAAQLTDELPD